MSSSDDGVVGKLGWHGTGGVGMAYSLLGDCSWTYESSIAVTRGLV
jgi:hypothetical protein